MGDLKRCPKCGGRCERWNAWRGDGEARDPAMHFIRCENTFWGNCDYEIADADSPAAARALHDKAVAKARMEHYRRAKEGEV